MPTLAVLMIIAANALGGLSYLAGNRAVQGLPPATVTCGRTAVAVAFMAFWLLSSGGLRWPFNRRETGRLLLVGLLAYAAPLLLGHIGVQWSPSKNGAILILLEPLSILAFSWLLLKESIAPLQVIGLLAGLAGAFWIAAEQADWKDLLKSDYTRGNLILALHGILWGLYTPLLKPLAARHRSLDLTFAPMLLALLLLFPAALSEAGQWRRGPYLASSIGWTIGLGVFVSFGSTFLWNRALKQLPASAVAPFVFIQPLAGVLAGTLALGEKLTRDALVGCGLVAAGVLLVIRLPASGQSSGSGQALIPPSPP